MIDFSFIVTFLWRVVMTLCGVYLLRECTGPWTLFMGIVAMHVAAVVSFRLRIRRSHG